MPELTWRVAQKTILRERSICLTNSPQNMRQHLLEFSLLAVFESCHNSVLHQPSRKPTLCIISVCWPHSQKSTVSFPTKAHWPKLFQLQAHPWGHQDIISWSSDLSSKGTGFKAVFPLTQWRRNHIYITLWIHLNLYSSNPDYIHSLKQSSHLLNFLSVTEWSFRDFQQTRSEEHLCQIRISRYFQTTFFQISHGRNRSALLCYKT